MNSSVTSEVFAEHAKKDDVKDVNKNQDSAKILQNGHDDIPAETTCLLLNNNSGRYSYMLTNLV